MLLAGNELLIELAKSTGVCDDCHANTTSEWVKGFRATVFGTVQAPADGTFPATLAVTDIQHSSVGCPESTAVLPTECVYERSDLNDLEAVCWEEDEGCRNLDDPFTKPTIVSENDSNNNNIDEPQLPPPPVDDAGESTSASSSSTTTTTTSLLALFGFVTAVSISSLN